MNESFFGAAKAMILNPSTSELLDLPKAKAKAAAKAAEAEAAKAKAKAKAAAKAAAPVDFEAWQYARGIQ